MCSVTKIICVPIFSAHVNPFPWAVHFVHILLVALDSPPVSLFSACVCVLVSPVPVFSFIFFFFFFFCSPVPSELWIVLSSVIIALFSVLFFRLLFLFNVQCNNQGKSWPSSPSASAASAAPTARAIPFLLCCVWLPFGKCEHSVLSTTICMLHLSHLVVMLVSLVVQQCFELWISVHLLQSAFCGVNQCSARSEQHKLINKSSCKFWRSFSGRHSQPNWFRDALKNRLVGGVCVIAFIKAYPVSCEMWCTFLRSFGVTLQVPAAADESSNIHRRPSLFIVRLVCFSSLHPLLQIDSVSRTYVTGVFKRNSSSCSGTLFLVTTLSVPLPPHLRAMIRQ